MLVTETIVTMVSLYNAIIFALMYTLVVAVPSIFKHYYGFDNTGQSLAFLGAIIGTLSTSAPLVLVDLFFY
jgi:DHA1 family multidrug resistance protein-like MFS transporter